MTNIKPQMQFIIVCDAVAHSPDGRKTLVGLFNRLVPDSFPYTHPFLTVMTRWAFGEGEHRMHVRIFDSAQNVVFEPVEDCRFRLENPLATADIALTIRNLTFPKPGTYWVRILLNGVPEDHEDALYVLRSTGVRGHAVSGS